MLRHFGLGREELAEEMGRVLSLTSKEGTLKMVRTFLKDLSVQDRAILTQSFLDSFVWRGNMDPNDPCLLMRVVATREELDAIVKPLIITGDDNTLSRLILYYHDVAENDQVVDLFKRLNRDFLLLFPNLQYDDAVLDLSLCFPK